MSTQSQILPSFGELLLSIGAGLPSDGPFSLPTDPSPVATSYHNIGKIARGRPKKKMIVLAQGERCQNATTISMLPDDVFLEIFDFSRKYVADYERPPYWAVWSWHRLAHVCQRWRHIIFGSPHRLDLRILCTYGTPVRESPGIWPHFPLVLLYQCGIFKRKNTLTPSDEDSIIAALEHPDLVSSLSFAVPGSQLRKIAAMMQEPFPMLTHLSLKISTKLDRNALVLPAEFLRGPAPCLEMIDLQGIHFPALPRFLLSASDLTYLFLCDMPPTGYISPEAMVVFLAALPRLETFRIEFQLATPRPDRIHPPPATRIVLPALKEFVFRGASEYLEDLVSRIDSPQLDYIEIDYLNQLVDFQVTLFSKFIDRSVGSKLTLFGHAHVYFRNNELSFIVYGHPDLDLDLEWILVSTTIKCEEIDWQISHMAQVLSQISATLSTIDHLGFSAEPNSPLLEGTDDVEWQHLLYQFSAVKTLRVYQELAGHVALALEQSTEETVAEVLPSLDLIYLAGQPKSSIRKFVTARQLFGRPVTVIDTKTEFEKRLFPYIKARGEYVPAWLR